MALPLSVAPRAAPPPPAAASSGAAASRAALPLPDNCCARPSPAALAPGPAPAAAVPGPAAPGGAAASRPLPRSPGLTVRLPLPSARAALAAAGLGAMASGAPCPVAGAAASAGPAAAPRSAIATPPCPLLRGWGCPARVARPARRRCPAAPAAPHGRPASRSDPARLIVATGHRPAPGCRRAGWPARPGARPGEIRVARPGPAAPDRPGSPVHPGDPRPDATARRRLAHWAAACCPGWGAAQPGCPPRCRVAGSCRPSRLARRHWAAADSPGRIGSAPTAPPLRAAPGSWRAPLRCAPTCVWRRTATAPALPLPFLRDGRRALRKLHQRHRALQGVGLQRLDLRQPGAHGLGRRALHLHQGAQACRLLGPAGRRFRGIRFEQDLDFDLRRGNAAHHQPRRDQQQRQHMQDERDGQRRTVAPQHPQGVRRQTLVLRTVLALPGKTIRARHQAGRKTSRRTAGRCRRG